MKQEWLKELENVRALYQVFSQKELAFNYKLYNVPL